jgi:hypothetical protein
MPVLQHLFCWKLRSVICGITYWRSDIRLFHGTTKSTKVVELFKSLKVMIAGKLLMRWTGPQANRSKLIRADVAVLNGRIMLQRQPIDAVQINRVECSFGVSHS